MDILKGVFNLIEDAYHTDQVLNLQILVHRKSVTYSVKSANNISWRQINAIKRRLFRETPAKSMIPTQAPDKVIQIDIHSMNVYT